MPAQYITAASWREAVDQEIRIRMAVLKKREPTQEELKEVREDFEADIEQSNYKYKKQVLFSTRIVLEGLGFFGEREYEPYLIYRWSEAERQKAT